VWRDGGAEVPAKGRVLRLSLDESTVALAPITRTSILASVLQFELNDYRAPAIERHELQCTLDAPSFTVTGVRTRSTSGRRVGGATRKVCSGGVNR